MQVQRTPAPVKLPRAEDILDGKITTLAVNEISAQYTLIVNLCYELKERFENIGRKDNQKWHGYFDNMLQFIMNNLGTELIIMGMRTAVVTYRLPLNYKEIKNWNEFHQKYGKYITGISE